MFSRKPIVTSNTPQYSSAQVRTLNFKGTQIRYVTDPEGTRYYYYTDVCAAAGRRSGYRPISIKRSNEYKIIFMSTLKGTLTLSAITARGIKLMSMALNSQTLKALAEQASNEQSDESKPEPQNTINSIKQPTGEATYQAYQVNALDFRGTKIRYVVNTEGERYYYYDDVNALIGRSIAHETAILSRSNECQTITVKEPTGAAHRHKTLTAYGIKLMSLTLKNTTLNLLTKQIETLNAESNNSVSQLADKARQLMGTTVNSIIRNVAKQPLYSDTIPYEFKGDEATFTITDSNTNIHVITLTTEQTYKLIGSLAVAITDHNDGQGERASMATEQEIINAVFNLLTETDRLPKENK